MSYPQFRILLDQSVGWAVMQEDYDGAVPYLLTSTPTLEDALRLLSLHVGGRKIAINVEVQP